MSQLYWHRGPADYTVPPPGATGQVTLPAVLNPSASVTVNITSDLLVEANETFKVEITGVSTPQPRSVSVPTTAKDYTVQITDDDIATFSIDAGPPVLEGNAGTKNVIPRIWMSKVMPVSIDITYRTVEGTGPNAADDGPVNQDFVPILSATYTIPAWTDPAAPPANLPTPVTIIGDTVVEPDEWLYVEIVSCFTPWPGYSNKCSVSPTPWTTIDILNDD